MPDTLIEVVANQINEGLEPIPIIEGISIEKLNKENYNKGLLSRLKEELNEYYEKLLEINQEYIKIDCKLEMYRVIYGNFKIWVYEEQLPNHDEESFGCAYFQFGSSDVLKDEIDRLKLIIDELTIEKKVKTELVSFFKNKKSNIKFRIDRLENNTATENSESDSDSD